MKRIIIILAIMTSVPFCVFSQKGIKYIQVSGQAAIPVSDLTDIVKTGFGFAGKGIYGFSLKPQAFTLEGGYNRFAVKDLPSDASAHYSAIPVYAGYRANLSNVVLESQAGVSFNRIAGSSQAGSASANQTAFGWALSAAYLYKSFELGIRYQSSEGSKDVSVIRFLGVRLGYNISL